MAILKTMALMAALTALFMAVGFLIGGRAGMMIALLLAAGTTLFAYWNSADMVLGTCGDREVSATAAPGIHGRIHGLVQELARRAGLPMPRLFLIDSDRPNAFATGRAAEPANGSTGCA